jgi:hypothetical protein
MSDDAQRVEFANVEVLVATDFVLRCRVEGKFVGVPTLRVLAGTEVARRGDRGHLVLPADLAEELGLIAWGAHAEVPRSSGPGRVVSTLHWAMSGQGVSFSLVDPRFRGPPGGAMAGRHRPEIAAT